MSPLFWNGPGIRGPVQGKDVVVVNVNQDARKPIPVLGDSADASLNDRVTIGEGIDLPMQLHARLDLR